MATITRFAPSPTGPLHLGGARTALFNYLHARINNGKFKLRIEDTDKERNSKESSKLIIESLNWLGLKVNDDIVYQSQNIKDHISVANSLLSKGLAYKCFHDIDYIDKFKSTKTKFKSEYRENQKNLPINKKFCIRIKAPYSGSHKINDKIQGNVKVNLEEIDDYIIIRSDGSPTFLLSSAIDDLNMKITDIIRGDDHLTNSFRQKIIFDFLDYKPNFAHISLLHNKNNQKMSKRDNSTSIIDYKNKGYLADAINNYLIRLGWSHGDEEIFSMQRMLETFSLNKIGKSPAKFDDKKLEFLNNHYLKNKTNKELLNYINDINLEFSNLDFFDYSKKLELIDLFKERSITLASIAQEINCLGLRKNDYNSDELRIISNFNQYKNNIVDKFSDIVDWNELNIEASIKGFIELNEISFKSIIQPLRLLVTGKLFGPSIYKLMEIIGNKETIQRIKTD